MTPNKAQGTGGEPVCFCDGNGWVPCWTLCNDGVVVDCADDLCGPDECMHGDGYANCGVCGGKGIIVCPAHD